jgi:hypothetical protein
MRDIFRLFFNLCLFIFMRRFFIVLLSQMAKSEGTWARVLSAAPREGTSGSVQAVMVTLSG